MRAALGFLADLDSLVCCIHYMLTHFHNFPYNYRSDIMLVPLRNGNIWKCSLKKSHCVQINLGKFNSDFSKYPLIRNKLRTHMNQRIKGLFINYLNIMFCVLKETSPRDDSFTHTIYLFEMARTQYGKKLIINNQFWRYIFLYFSPYNSNSRYFKIKSLDPMPSIFQDLTVYQNV